jgi:hypothetical protein
VGVVLLDDVTEVADEEDEDEEEEGRSCLAVVSLLLTDSLVLSGLRGTGDRGGRVDGRLKGERGDEGTGDKEGDSVGDFPTPLLARCPVLLGPPVTAVADDERVRVAAPARDADEADEEEGEGEAADRGERRVEAEETTGRCSFDCTVNGGLPIRLASAVGLDGTTRGGDEWESSSCLRSSLGELGVVEATDELVEVGTKIRGGRINTASISASACSNSTLRSLAVDDWRLCCREWFSDTVDGASASSSVLFSSSSACCFSAAALCVSACCAFRLLACCCC